MEWLSSKVAVAVAVLVITASVLGYFAFQRSDSHEGEVAEAARSMARYVEAFSSLTGEVRSNVTVGGGGNLELPSSINGNSVCVNMTRSYVIVACGGYSASEKHSAASVHLWQPGNGSYNTSSIALLDAENRWTGEVDGQGEFVLERKEIRVSGVWELHTFCYVAGAS